MLNETQKILDRLALADREHQKEAGGRLLLRGVRLLCLALLAAFALDVALHLRSGWRLTLLLALVAAGITFAGIAWYLAFVRRNRLEHIARFLESRDPALGSRLINFLQLRRQTDDPALTPLTRDLARQAVEDYAAGLGGTRFELGSRTGELGRQFRRAAWTMLGVAAALAAFFRISTIELLRFADPFGDHPPYSFTRLEIVQPAPAGTNVIFGKGLVVRAKAIGHQPKELFLTAFPPGHPEKALTLPMFEKGNSGFDQLLDNVRSELMVYVHTKDRVSISKQVRITVVLTPQVEKTFVRVAPPAYTGIKPEETSYAFKPVQVLEGSEVRFRLQSNRPLREGSLEVAIGDLPPQHITLSNAAENEVAGSIMARDSGRLRFTVTDVDGLASQDPCEGALTVTHDLPPEIRITEPDHDSFAAMDLRLKAHIEASDDYGLRTVRLHRGLNGVYSAPKTITYDGIVRDAHETLEFNIGELGVQPGDIISLFAEAVDTAPDPHLARSQTIRLLVISVEDYNNFLREQTDMADAEAKYSELNDDLQKLIENQKELAEAADALNGQIEKSDPKDRAARAQELDNLLAKQNELNRKLDQHAERMEKFVRDQPLYDVEKDLQEQLRQEAGNVRQSVQTNDVSTRDIAQRSSPPNAARQVSPEMLSEFKKAADEQAARLGGVKEQGEKQVVDKLDDLSHMQELVKDFNQFESLYRAQQELAQQSQAFNRSGTLSREDQLSLKELAGTEKQVGDLLNQLKDKLRSDAAEAEKLFPKAAQSGRDLAGKIEETRMRPLAEQATDQMLAGNGEQSFALADRLRGEMEKLFSQCQGGNCPSGSELDTYLKLQRMNPANNFAQMSRSRKFGSAQGQSRASGRGDGQSGTSGYAVADGSKINVLGNEMAPRNGGRQSRQSARTGTGIGTLAGNAGGSPDKPDVVKGLNPVNRQSGAVSSETVIEEYNNLVESYFKTITTQKKQQ